MNKQVQDHVVVDVEIAKTIQQVGGWDNTQDMGVSVAVLYEYATDRFRVYGGEDEQQMTDLRERIALADRVTGFNSWKFDFPVIWGFPGRHRNQGLSDTSDDLLRRIWAGAGLDPDVFNPRTHGGNSPEAAAGESLVAAAEGRIVRTTRRTTT